MMMKPIGIAVALLFALVKSDCPVQEYRCPTASAYECCCRYNMGYCNVDANTGSCTCATNKMVAKNINSLIVAFLITVLVFTAYCFRMNLLERRTRKTYAYVPLMNNVPIPHQPHQAFCACVQYPPAAKFISQSHSAQQSNCDNRKQISIADNAQYGTSIK
jgi:hypothetical protein